MQRLISWWKDRHKRRAAKWLVEHGWCPIHDTKNATHPLVRRSWCRECVDDRNQVFYAKRDKMRDIVKGIDGN